MYHLFCRLSASLSLGLLAISASAQKAKSPFIILGGGQATCKQLIEKDLFYITQPNIQWYFGYLTAMSAAANKLNKAGISKSELPRGLTYYSSDVLVAMEQSRCKVAPETEFWEIADDMANYLAGVGETIRDGDIN